jgi:hypothetical protein
MKRSLRFSGKVVLLVACLLSLVGFTQQKKSDGAEWKPVEAAMGRAGQLQPDGAMKFSLPRRDLKVTVNGTEIKAGLALGSWVAFQRMDNQAMLMGDLVLAENEVSPVMLKLQEGGVEITALHNHILGESPRVMYMHIGGHGDAVKLAQSVQAALALTKTPPAQASAPAAQSENIGIDTKEIESVLGHKGKVNGGVFQVGVPRAEKVMEAGMQVANSMGIATALNFQPTRDGKAAITGDFVLLGSEVNPVMKALHENGIEVTAVHSHMLDEQPRLFFMHFWANDDARKLARGLRAALDKTNSAKPESK